MKKKARKNKKRTGLFNNTTVFILQWQYNFYWELFSFRI